MLILFPATIRDPPLPPAPTTLPGAPTRTLLPEQLLLLQQSLAELEQHLAFEKKSKTLLQRKLTCIAKIVPGVLSPAGEPQPVSWTGAGAPGMSSWHGAEGVLQGGTGAQTGCGLGGPQGGSRFDEHSGRTAQRHGYKFGRTARRRYVVDGHYAHACARAPREWTMPAQGTGVLGRERVGLETVQH